LKSLKKELAKLKITLKTTTMKTLKSIIYTLLISVFTISCSSNQIEDPLNNPNEINETAQISASAKTVVEVVKTHVKSDGSFNNSSNPESSMTYDLGFKFSFPVTLQYNNGTKVVVNSIQDLAIVAKDISSSNFIEGIIFPFTVDVAGALISIADENNFVDLVNSYDTDNDGITNYLDTDDDGDGALDIDEDANKDGDSTTDDADHDGMPNYLDTDSDNDGQLDVDEDNDGDGNFTNDDSDNDGIPDYTDTDSDNDGIDDGVDTDDDNDGIDDENETHDGSGDTNDDDNDSDNENGSGNDDNGSGSDNDDNGSDNDNDNTGGN
jgi:hypothetical protein